MIGCGNGLPHCHIAGNNDSIHRRNNVGIIEIDLCAGKFGLPLFNCCLIKRDLRLSLLICVLCYIEGLVGKLAVMQVERAKCRRKGRYAVARLIEQRGRDAKVID